MRKFIKLIWLIFIINDKTCKEQFYVKILFFQSISFFIFYFLLNCLSSYFKFKQVRPVGVRIRKYQTVVDRTTWGTRRVFIAGTTLAISKQERKWRKRNIKMWLRSVFNRNGVKGHMCMYKQVEFCTYLPPARTGDFICINSSAINISKKSELGVKNRL